MGHYETVDGYHTVLFGCCADSTYTVYLLPDVDMTPLKQQLPLICVSSKATAQMFVVKMTQQICSVPLCEMGIVNLEYSNHQISPKIRYPAMSPLLRIRG